MIWKYILIDRNGIEYPIDDPKGWEGNNVDINRDELTHGIWFNYAVDRLEFHGEGATLIKTEYDEFGVNGAMELKIFNQCSDGESYDLFYYGRLSFDQYDDTCGDECIVTIGLEEKNDIELFKNNYEQKVNLYNDTAFDETTELNDYTRLNTDLEIPSRGLTQKSDAMNETDRVIQFFDQDNFPDFYNGWEHMATGNNDTEEGMFPVLFTESEIHNTEIGADGTQFTIFPTYWDISPNSDPGDVFPLLVVPGNTGSVACYPKNFSIGVHLQGSLNYTAFGQHNLQLYVKIMQGPDPGNATLIAEDFAISGDFVSSQNHNWTIDIDVSPNMIPGNTLWIYWKILYWKNQLGGGNLTSMQFTQASGSYINIEQTTVCDPTISKVSFINEAISRVSEAITNGRIVFYSTTFGRTDSEPYSIATNPCPGLFAITNGLNIRRKLMEDNTQPGFFLTMRELFEGLNGIWNIGYTIEPDPIRPGFNRLRFEDWRYFYQDDIGIIFNYATRIRRSVDTNRLFNRMNVGYNKWEAGETTGLNEYMTTRTYRLNLNAISKELDVTTDFVCSPYTIEQARRLDESTKDWQYDNDIHGFCLIKDGVPYRVEMFSDSVFSAENINDPESSYNARITPARNAMRWFNWIMQGYRKLTTLNKLIFSSGTGNYIAKLQLSNCNIESHPLSESENLEIADFKDEIDARPPLFPELVTFEHPMNYNLFKQIKNEPTLRFKSILIRCGEKNIPGWIKSINYRPEQGQATIVAYPKNDNQIPVLPPEGCQASIMEGSVTMTDFDPIAQTAIIDFTEGNPGATLWSYIVTEGSTPGSGPGFNGITTEHPFTVTGITPGQWSVLIIPYCNSQSVGINYGEGTFNFGPPPLAIELSAEQLPNGRFRITAVPVGAATMVSDFSFRFGQCVYRSTIFPPRIECKGYPSAPVLPNGYVTFFGVINSGYNYADTGGIATPSSPLISLTLHGLVGITPGQITKAAGQSWTLNFE